MPPDGSLNRWIVPLEKRYDYPTSVTGEKIEIRSIINLFHENLTQTSWVDEARFAAHQDRGA